MTEQTTVYNNSQDSTLNVEQPSSTYILLIDGRVSNYHEIINSKQPGVTHIVFNPPERLVNSAILIKNIEEKIAELGVPTITGIGLVQHNHSSPTYEMFGRTTDLVKPIIHAVGSADPDLQSWNSISLFITMLRLNYGIQYFDMMACALYSNPNWKFVIDKLTEKTGVTIRASTDDTGAASLGGDWFLETHTGVNLKSIYFTESIENYNGLLYTAPATTTSSGSVTKKLILIDNRIRDIDVIINSMNEDTYCLVFNYFYDTPASILSKLRFLSGANRYILDNFYYEPPSLPTRMDASGNHCTPCDDFDINDIQLVPGMLQNEYLEYTMSAADISGGVWPFYSESTNITINKPVFFQRAKIGDTEQTVPYGTTELTTVTSNYKTRPMILVGDLDAFYELGQNAGEIVGGNTAFDCVGIIQHTVEPYIGYKFVSGSDDSIQRAIVQDIQMRDANLSSWSEFSSFIQTLKTMHQMTTLDMMACALYSNPDWKYVIDTLAVRENITIRASLDNTGSASDDGNWVLETNNVSLTNVYFTDKIYEWKYVLATYIDTRFNALRWNDSMYATRAYDARLKIAAGTSSFTIEAWYYETSAQTNGTIVDMGDYNYTFQVRTIGGGGLNLYNPSTGWILATAVTITPGQWNHVAITRSGSAFTFYLNGIARQTITNSTSLYSNNSTFAIGWQSPDTCLCNRQKTDSVLYDIRLWNVARTATEIQMFRNRVVPANSTGLVANYLCTDNGGTFNDRSANALHTTIQNYNSARWSNNTVTIPNIGFLINNGFSLRTSNTSTPLNAFTHFDNITYTDFSGVDLSGVNFRGADLTGCNFTNANLTNTNFANAYLINATMTNAITTGSNISQAITNLSSTVLNFDGVDDAVNVGVPAWTYSTQFRTTMTVECWFKTTDTNNLKGSATLVGRYNTGGSAGGAQFLLGVGGTGAVTLALTNTAGTWFQVTSPLTYKDMLWHHAVGTYNSATGVSSVYVDGVLVNSGTNATYGLLSNNTTLRLTFGSDDAGTSPNTQTDRQFRGAISDVRIWNVVRSAAEIAANYQMRLAGNETGLLGYWKLNQGLGTGWGSYSTAIDSTINRAHGTLLGMGTTPSGSWVVSNINFQPRISTITLGPNNGVYNLTSSTFSFIDPTSNSLGNFTYALTPSSVASITNGATTTKTIYSTSAANLVTTLSLFEFPEIASLSNWQIDLSFTVTSGDGTWRALIGDMYNSVSPGRGWGIWVSASTPRKIHWSWLAVTSEPAQMIVALNTPYVLTAAQNSGTITLTLNNMANTYDTSTSISNLVASYFFDNNANDTSTNNNNLTNISNVTYNTTDYKRGTAAAAFNGSNYYQVTNDGRFSPDNLTIAFWIKPKATSGTHQALASCRTATGNLSGWFIYIAPNNNLEFFTGSPGGFSGGSVYSNFGALFQNIWVHIAITVNKSSGSFILYINGSSFLNTTRSYVNNTGTNLRIGAGANEGSADFIVRNGTLMDDFRIYNKVLTATEVSSIVSPISNIVGWYGFDSNANDASPNNNNLTNTNSVTYNTSDFKRGTAAAAFNGSNHFQIVNDGRFSPDNFTVACWVKPVDSAGNYQSIATCRDGYSFRGWMIYIGPTNDLQFITGSGSGWSYNADALLNNIGTINTWVHIAFTLSKSTNTVVAYINGNLQATITRTYTNNVSYPLRIGAGGDFTNGDLFVKNGTLIDDFRFYNKVLTATEIGTIVAGSSYSASFSVGANVLGKGPVTIGGWQNIGGEIFPGTISYVNVSVPTNQRLVTLASSTGVTPATVTATQASFLDYSSGSRSASLTVNGVTPTLSTTFANMTRTFNHSFALEVPVSNSSGAFTFDSSNTAVATINPPITINALQFNGTTNFVDFGANIIELGQASFTIECWVKTNGTSMGLLNCQDSDTTWESGEKSLYIDGNGIPAFVGFGCNWIYSTVAVNDNAWHHIAVTWSFAGGSSGTGAIYIDGINRTSTNYSIYAVYAANTFNVGTFIFGKPNYSESVNFFNGAVCELRIWNVARSAGQIFQNYRRLLVGNETGLILYNRFNQGIATGANTEINRVENNDLIGGYTGILSGNFTLTGSSSNWVSGVSIRPEYDVNVLSNGSTLITATQASTSSFSSLSITATLTVTKIEPTIGTLSVPSKSITDVPFNLTAPTSNVGSTSTITSTASVMIEPPDMNALIYGASWRKLGGDIDGEAAGDQSGFSVASSADGTIIAIGARLNNAGYYNRTPPSFYLRTGGSNWRDYIPLSTANTTINLQIWGPDEQFYTLLTAANEIAKQFSYFAGYWLNATRATNGQSFRVPAFAGQGSVGTFTFTATSSFPVTSYTGSLTSYNSNTTYTLTAQTDGINAGRIQTDAIYIRNGGSNWRDYVPLFPADTTTNRLGWTPDSQFNNVNVAPQNEIAMQFSYYAGYWLNAARATNGENFSVPAFTAYGSVGTFTFTATSNYPVTTYTGRLSGYNSTTYTLTPQNDAIAAGQLISGDSGHVRVYRYNPSKIISNALGPAGWDKLGGDIDGELPDDYSGTSVSLSANGTTLAIGANHNDGTGVSSGHVRVFSYNPSKVLANALGPAGWDQLGGDIDGEASGNQSGGNDWNPDGVKLSADGTIVAITGVMNGGSAADAGHVRVYKYTPTKLVAVTNQNDASFGPIGWNRLGADIDGEAATDYSGWAAGLSADGTTVAIGAWANDGAGNNAGHVRVYKYTPSKLVAVTNQNDASFGPIGWNRLGADIDGEAAGDRSGTGIALSSDGTIVAIGSHFNNSMTGHVRVYKYTPGKDALVTNQNDLSFGPIGWTRLGQDIDGEAINDQSGDTVALSADGTIVAIGAPGNAGSGTSAGHARVYKYTPTKSVAVTNQLDASFGPIGWTRLGIDFDAEAANDSFTRVALSSDGTTLVIGARYNDGTTGNTSDNRGHVRVYNIPTTNTISYSSSNSSVADICGNLLLIKGVNGSSTITASQTSNIVTGILDVSGTTYTLRYTPFTYTSSNAAVATVTSSGTVNLVGNGTTTITASQAETRSYIRRDVSGLLVVSSTIAPTIGTFTVLGKNFGDAPFILTAPTSNSNGRFSYSSNNPNVAIITPNTFTTTSLLARYDTSQASNYTLSGSVVTQWNDLTGNGYHLTQNGTGPTLTTINSVTAFDFNSGRGLIRASTVPLSSAITVFMVIKYSTNIGSWGSFMHHGNRDTDWAIERNSWPNALTSHNIQFQSNNVNGPPELSTTNNVNYILIGRINGSTREFWRYSDTEALGFASGTGVSIATGNKSIYVGKSDNNESCNSTIGEILYYNSSLSNADVSSNLLYLQTKWFNSVNTQSYITIVGAGTSTITATQEASGNYTSGSVSTSFVVAPIAPSISAWTITDVSFGVAPFSLTAPSSNSNGRFVYSNSTNTNVATVTSLGVITVVGAGSTTITATQDASGNYTSRSVTGTLVVAPIAPTYQTISQITKTYSIDVSFSLLSIMTGISNSDGAYTFSSSSNVIDICGGFASILAYTPSAITITANQIASNNYTANSTTFLLLVNRKTPSYGEFSVPAKTFGDVSFSIAPYAPTTDSVDVPFTYTSSEQSVATINSSGTVITIIGQGYTTITASQEASGNYAANSITTSFLVNRAAPTFLKPFTIPNKRFGDSPFSLLPFTDGLDNTDGTYHFTSSNAELVSISNIDGVTATIHAYTPSPITIYVAIDACGNYAASSTSGTLTVERTTPNIGALTLPNDKKFRDASFNLTAPTSDSSGVFRYTSDAPSVATVTLTGGIVTIVGAGTATITATQDACGNFVSRDVSGSLVIAPIAPTIGTFTIPDKNIIDGSFNLTAPTSDSSGVFRYTSDASGVATVTLFGGLVTLVGVGIANITATQEASGNFTSRSITTPLVVNAVLSNFTVPSNKIYGDGPFDLTNPTSIYNNEPFIFTSSVPTVASIGGAGGRTVTIHKAGTTTLTAKQLATNEHPELIIYAILVISKKTPVITLSAISKVYGDASFNLSPSSTNTDVSGSNGDGFGGGLFSYISSNSDIVSIFDTSFVGITGVGSALIHITQTETANFTSGNANIMVTIIKATPILSAFSVSTTRLYGFPPFSALAYPTSISNGAITYSSSDPTVATIDNNGIITVLAAGYVNFTATQAATVFYNSTTKISNTMTVQRLALPLTRLSPTSSVINKIYGESYFTVSATNASNGGTITYETDTPSVAGIVGSNTAGVISVVSVGTATITARREQTAQYTSEPVSWTVEVGRATTTLTGLSDLSYNVTTAPFTVSASSASDGIVTYSLQDPSSPVLTIHPTSGLVTLLSPGSAVIVASQAQGTLYLAPTSITATITVSTAGNALQGATLTNTTSFTNVNLEGASLAGVSITNTTFTAANLTNADLTNAVIVSANFASAELAGATLTGATITGATFTSASLNNANLSGATLTNTVFTGSDLSGANLVGVNATGASFANAKLNNVNLSGANVENVNFTNTSIKGAIIDDISFSPLQKLQLLRNSDNRDIGQIIIPAVTGTTVLAAISPTSPLRDISNLDLTSASVSVAVVVPQTSTSPTAILPNVVLDVQNSDKFYLPINESEYFQIEGIKYYTTSGVVRNFTTNSVVEVINYNGNPVWLIAGSIFGLVLQTNTLSTTSFVVPQRMLLTDTTPFMPTTFPTSNSGSPIVYSSNNPDIATIDASSGLITVTGNSVGEVRFIASQVQNSTYGPGTKMSNIMIVDRTIHFSLPGLNQVFNLSTLAILDASSVNMTTDATSIFYVRLSDIVNMFKYQSDSNDINDVSANDIKYYVFHRKWPTELKINPCHAMMNTQDSQNMLGLNGGFTPDKSLLKHDFLRYIALRLFNTIHGVDLFRNELDLQENATYLGETVRYNIDNMLSGISTTSSSETMSYDSSGNKYLTNDVSGNINICRELMRQIASSAPGRFYNNGPDNREMKNVPFVENDTIQFKVILQAAAQQNILTNVSVIPSRSYAVKLILKNTVTSVTNANTVVLDSEMYPNSYPYSSSVTTFAPTTASSAVYNIYSPPAPIPFTRFGYNGWYYTNSSSWVSVAPSVRNHIKWLVPSNTGSSKVADLQYIRINLKIHNNASLPYLMIYTESNSSRKYAVFGGNGSLTNGTLYSIYMNFNSYSREPAMFGYQPATLAYTVGTGAFANNEIITSIALETESNAPAGNVEFTLASVIVGELSTTNGTVSEKEYGFEAAVPDSYP